MEIYGNLMTCGKCKLVHKMLEDREIEFDFISDEKQVMQKAQEKGMMGIPFAIIDNKCYNSTELIQHIIKL